jgi:hypothetical protein
VQYHVARVLPTRGAQCSVATEQGANLELYCFRDRTKVFLRTLAGDLSNSTIKTQVF